MISRHILAFKAKDPELQCYLEKNNNMSLRMTIKSKCLVPRTRGLHERREGSFLFTRRSWDHVSQGMIVNSLSNLEQGMSYIAN